MISGFTATNTSLSAQTATIEVTPTFTFGGIQMLELLLNLQSR